MALAITFVPPLEYFMTDRKRITTWECFEQLNNNEWLGNVGFWPKFLIPLYGVLMTLSTLDYEFYQLT